MSGVIQLLARQTLRQVWMDRLPLAVPAYALAAVTLVPLAAHLTLGASSRGAWEMGLALQWLIVCAAGGWLGLSVGLELERRTAAVVLSGPVDAGTWLLGRGLGSGLALAALIAALQLIWIAVCAFRGLEIGVALLFVTLALWLEGAIVAALTALLSTRSRPLLAVGASTSIWVAGHLSGEYSRVTQEWGAGGLATVVFTVIPDLDLLDLHAPLVSGATLDPGQTAGALAYGLCWLAGLCALTVASVRGRDLA